MASLTKSRYAKVIEEDKEASAFTAWGFFVAESQEFAPWYNVYEVTDPQVTVTDETETKLYCETTVRIRYTVDKEEVQDED